MLQYILASGIGRSEKDVITILSTTMFLQEYVYIYTLQPGQICDSSSHSITALSGSLMRYTRVQYLVRKNWVCYQYLNFKAKVVLQHYFRRVLLDYWYESFLQQTLPESILLRSQLDLQPFLKGHQKGRGSEPQDLLNCTFVSKDRKNEKGRKDILVYDNSRNNEYLGTLTSTYSDKICNLQAAIAKLITMSRNIA